MKVLLITFLFSTLTVVSFSQGSDIKLNEPDLNREGSIMHALLHRFSASEFDTTALSLQDLSDLLWAGNGINRPKIGKRTAPSALNAQDIDIYVFINSGVYLYKAKANVLEQISEIDNRQVFSDTEGAPLPPLICLLVSDISRFRFGEPAMRKEWAAMDAGIVTQNILLFCASAKMAARPKAGMDKETLKELLKLTENQFPMLNIPVSYEK